MVGVVISASGMLGFSRHRLLGPKLLCQENIPTSATLGSGQMQLLSPHQEQGTCFCAAYLTWALGTYSIPTWHTVTDRLLKPMGKIPEPCLLPSCFYRFFHFLRQESLPGIHQGCHHMPAGIFPYSLITFVIIMLFMWLFNVS